MQLNKKKIVRTALCAVLVSALGYSFVAKSETKLIPFQGKLTDASGQVISDGAIVVQFKMYDAPVGGQAKWNGEVQMLSVNGGLVNTTLGTKASLKNVDFSSPTYLEITIDANGDNQIGPEDPPLLPRQSIIPAVYAVQAGEAKNAKKLDGYDWSVVFSNGDPVAGTINGAKLAAKSVSTAQIANNAVTAAQVANGAITSAKLANGAVTSSQLAKNSVTTDKLATNSITADKLDLSESELNKLVLALDKYLSKPIEGRNWTVQLGAGTCLEMNWVNPGTFMMGSPKNELGRGDNETLHQVTLTKGFWLGKYEVTQAQWYAAMETDPSYFKGSLRPVEQVSYELCMAFCKRLTAIQRAAGRLSDKYEYTLPTEAQWEYACRAGTTTALNNGKDLTTLNGLCPNLSEVAWYGNDNGSGGTAKGVTHMVGMLIPNAWGFYDMQGNVWEWCLDWYGTYPDMEVTDPLGPDNNMGYSRVHRGGSWVDIRWCRSSTRGVVKIISDHAAGNLGFRLALVPVQ